MTDTQEIARKMRGPSGTGRVLILDVNFSSTKYGLRLGERASRHAFYLRPPDGMTANDLKEILDEAGGEAELEFRYYVYPELHTDLKPILTLDPYATKHFLRDDERRFLQLEGERTKARETIAQILSGLKDPFQPDDFPRIHEFSLDAYRAADARPVQIVLRRKDGDRDELRKSEPGFHMGIAEHGFAAEIEIHRPVVADSDTVLILNTNEHTGEKGRQFLADFAAYFETEQYKAGSQRAVAQATEKKAAVAPTPAYIPHEIRAPQTAAPKMDQSQLTAQLTSALKDLLPSMKLLKSRQVERKGPHITIAFPGKFGFGKGPSKDEIKEIELIFRTLKGDPSFGANWQASYQVDGKTGEVRIEPSTESNVPNGWTRLQ